MYYRYFKANLVRLFMISTPHPVGQGSITNLWQIVISEQENLQKKHFGLWVGMRSISFESLSSLLWIVVLVNNVIRISYSSSTCFQLAPSTCREVCISNKLVVINPRNKLEGLLFEHFFLGVNTYLVSLARPLSCKKYVSQSSFLSMATVSRLLVWMPVKLLSVRHIDRISRAHSAFRLRTLKISTVSLKFTLGFVSHPGLKIPTWWQGIAASLIFLFVSVSRCFKCKMLLTVVTSTKQQTMPAWSISEINIPWHQDSQRQRGRPKHEHHLFDDYEVAEQR